jgi:hypothetical protein
MLSLLSVIAIHAFAKFAFALEKYIEDEALRYNGFVIFSYDNHGVSSSRRYGG